MEAFQSWFHNIESIPNRQTIYHIIKWMLDEFPMLQGTIAWNQPHLTNQGTFITAFSIAKKHIAFGLETQIIDQFRQEATQLGFEVSTHLIKMKWEHPFDESLFRNIITASMKLKENTKAYWYQGN